MKNDLGVGTRGELMSLAEQLFPEFHEVEDLAVEGDPECGVFVGHGLVAAGEIDDA